MKAAIAAFRRALSVYQETGNRAHEGVAWNALSVALNCDNPPTEAEHARQQAEAAFATSPE